MDNVKMTTVKQATDELLAMRTKLGDINKKEPVLTFRFDDVCVNSSGANYFEIVDYLFSKFPNCKVIWGLSLLTNNNCGQRVYPKILNAYSDYRKFYEVDRASNLDFFTGHSRIIIASHGLIHVDHRIISGSAQEMSILVSCSLVKSKIFIPPFNKWNEHTEIICAENGIELIKFEDGWRCLEYEQHDPAHKLWYLHAREWTLDRLKNWFDGEKNS